MSSEPKLTGAEELSRAVRRGRLFYHDGALPLVVSTDFLVALARAVGPGPSGREGLHGLGVEWGKTWLQRVDAAGKRLSATVQELAMDDMQILLFEEMSQKGWGRPLFDVHSLSAHGLFLVQIVSGPFSVLEGDEARGAATLLAGYFSGIFSGMAGVAMAGLGVPANDNDVMSALIVIGHESKIAAMQAKLDAGSELRDVLPSAV